MLAPILEEVAVQNTGILKVGKVNVDEENELAMTFRISAIPTVILFKDGQPVDQFMGYMPKGSVDAFLSKHLQSTDI